MDDLCQKLDGGNAFLTSQQHWIPLYPSVSDSGIGDGRYCVELLLLHPPELVPVGVERGREIQPIATTVGHLGFGYFSLLNIYRRPLGKMIFQSEVRYHLYIYDTQLYISTQSHLSDAVDVVSESGSCWQLVWIKDSSIFSSGRGCTTPDKPNGLSGGPPRLMSPAWRG